MSMVSNKLGFTEDSSSEFRSNKFRLLKISSPKIVSLLTGDNK